MPMPTLTIDQLEIPFDIQTLEGFRAWVRTLGESAPLVSFIDGDVFVEMTPQNYRTHSPVVACVNGALNALAEAGGTGMYCVPPSWFTCVEAGISTEPDGFFVRYDTLQKGLLQVHPDHEHEMVGRPDFVLEVVSPSSRRKDVVRSIKAYAKAGIAEYWLIDARPAEVVFRLYVLRGRKYVETAPGADGWRSSPTWKRAFRLRRFINPAGLPEFRLDTQST
jgi:Uma2 family endonuclease